jgi:putative chitinase
MGISAARAALWAPHLASACQYAELSTRERRAAFVAQIGHESGSLQYVREIWGPTSAQRRYEGRRDLGNTQTGDGFRYRGRGLIQITGRANYARLTERLHGLACPNFEAYPEALEQPRWAALSAADFWADHDLNRLVGDFKALTKAINGGLNGYDDRHARYERAVAAFKG